jgi:beta-galactosidase
MDYYGFHYGLVWYRGHFTATGSETGITIDGETGAHGVYSAWLNGTFLGSYSSGPHTISIPTGTLKANTAAEVSVLIGNMGHDEDFRSSDTHKSPRGLTTASLQGSTAAISWKIQGDKGGENIVDPARGPFNTGGLYGERKGWYLPGYNSANWKSVTLPDRWSASGIPAGIGWYRTSFNLHLPAKMDIPIGLHFSDATYNYQALIYVNGWLMGRYWNTVGPQTTFSLPAGILNTHGRNTVAIAVWGLDAQSGGLGQVSLIPYGEYAQ